MPALKGIQAAWLLFVARPACAFGAKSPESDLPFEFGREIAIVRDWS